MAAGTVYTDIIDGNEYDLPSETPTNGFREGVYDTDQATATGSTARIRALLYVWQETTLPSAPLSTTGPFYASSTNALSKESKDAMRLDSTSGTSNFITLLSDSGYAPDFDGEEECSDNPGGKDPWETIIETFNYDASGGSNPTAYMRRYFPPTAANSGRSESEKLDIWQDDPDDYGTKKGNIVICSDIFHLITPTRYSQATNTLPSFDSETDYENYSKVDQAFSNIFQLVKPGGALIFSVPYDGNPEATTGQVTEKAPFPNTVTDNEQKCHLWSWEHVTTAETEELQNDPRNTESPTELIGDLGFTRSINCPSVLRSFTRGALSALLTSAGFTSITFHPITGGMNAFGIYWNATISSGTWTGQNTVTNGTLQSKSLIITATRPSS